MKETKFTKSTNLFFNNQSTNSEAIVVLSTPSVSNTKK